MGISDRAYRACAYQEGVSLLLAIRLKLLKLGALVRVSVRRVKLAMASACPWQHEFALAHALLARAAG